MLVCQDVLAVIYISIGRYLKNWAATNESCIILQMEYSPPSIRLMIRPIHCIDRYFEPMSTRVKMKCDLPARLDS